jgi:hypothetical protein
VLISDAGSESRRGCVLRARFRPQTKSGAQTDVEAHQRSRLQTVEFKFLDNSSPGVFCAFVFGRVAGCLNRLSCVMSDTLGNIVRSCMVRLGRELDPLRDSQRWVSGRENHTNYYYSSDGKRPWVLLDMKRSRPLRRDILLRRGANEMLPPFA